MFLLLYEGMPISALGRVFPLLPSSTLTSGPDMNAIYAHARSHLLYPYPLYACSDFGEWRDRLHCFGLDFRDLAELERFCAYMKSSFTRLDIIINNAW